MNFQMCFIREALVTGRRYLCPDHRIGYLAAESLGIGWSATLGAVLALVTGVAIRVIFRWCGISSGTRRLRLRRHYHQPAAG